MRGASGAPGAHHRTDCVRPGARALTRTDGRRAARGAALATELRAAMATLDPPRLVHRPGDVAAALRRLLPRLAAEAAPDPEALPFRFDRFDPAATAAAIGRDLAALHRRMAGSGRPSLPALLAAAYDALGMDPATPERRVAMVAAVLAQVTPAPRYHNARHTREVVADAIWLAAATPELGAGDRALLYLAAAVHDLGHDGGTNERTDRHGRRRWIPGFLEDRSLALILPVARRAGVAAARCEDLATMVRQTDIVARPALTALHDVVLGGAGGGGADGGGRRLDAPADKGLARLRSRPGVLRTAALLADADVMASAGLSRASQKLQDSRFAAERGIATTPDGTLLFLDRMLGGRFITAAGRRLDPNLARLRAAIAAASATGDRDDA